MTLYLSKSPSYSRYIVNHEIKSLFPTSPPSTPHPVNLLRPAHLDQNQGGAQLNMIQRQQAMMMRTFMVPQSTSQSSSASASSSAAAGAARAPRESWLPPMPAQANENCMSQPGFVAFDAMAVNQLRVGADSARAPVPAQAAVKVTTFSSSSSSSAAAAPAAEQAVPAPAVKKARRNRKRKATNQDPEASGSAPPAPIVKYARARQDPKKLICNETSCPECKCNRIFRAASALNEHVRAKQGHFDYPCGQMNDDGTPCEWKAAYSTSQREHWATKHTTAKPHACPGCDFRHAVNGKTLRFHKKTCRGLVADADQPYTCKKCGEFFFSADSLRVHLFSGACFASTGRRHNSLSFKKQ